VVIRSVPSTRPHSGKRLKKPSVEGSGLRRDAEPLRTDLRRREAPTQLDELDAVLAPSKYGCGLGWSRGSRLGASMGNTMGRPIWLNASRYAL
jgi:hypothetical protein